MKILLVCAGGMSTGLLMKKMEKYWEERGRRQQYQCRRTFGIHGCI